VKQPAYTYDELDEVLRGNGRSGNVGISAIDGMIAALVAGPAFLHPEEWLPIIFAGRVPDVLDGTPEHLAVNTIFDRYNEVSFMFMNHEGRVIVSDWAAGFMLIVAKRPDAWTKILFTDTRKVLAPIFASHELGVGFLPDIPKAEIDQLRAVAHYHVADAVVALREACAPQRSAAAEITQSQPESRQVRRAARRRAV
jgi:yecA family protein